MSAPTRSVCPQCREVKLPHQICAKCGFYKGREILSVEGE
jgi:large subunit ribosomal protein L32